MKRINHDDPRWTDFVLSELPEHEMAALRQVMENDAAVQTVLAETDQLACLIREGFRNEVYELGESRREAIRKAGRIPDKGTVVSMTRRRRDWVRPAPASAADVAKPDLRLCPASVSYTHLTLPTNREV